MYLQYTFIECNILYHTFVDLYLYVYTLSVCIIIAPPVYGTFLPQSATERASRDDLLASHHNPDRRINIIHLNS